MQALKHLRKRALHQVAVFQHVGNAGRHAQIVFQDIDLAVAVAHQVGSGDVAPDPPRRIDARALGAVEGGRMDDLFRDDLVLQDLLVVINVVDELVERVDALLEAALDPVPLLGADDARNQVEGENALRARRISVDVEGDAHLEEQALRRALAAQKLALLERLDGVEQQASLRPHHSGIVEHLIPESLGLISIEPHSAPLGRHLSKSIGYLRASA